MFVVNGFGGVEGSVRPDVFPRKVVLYTGALELGWEGVEIIFDQNGIASVTYEWLANFCQKAGILFVDKGRGE